MTAQPAFPPIQPDRLVLAIGLLSGLVAVALAAFGAHGPLAPIDPIAQRQLGTASLFHLTHSLGLMLLAFWPAAVSWRRAVALSWLVGIVLFAGSLYSSTMFAVAWPGLLTPLGGLFLMSGWLAWLVGVLGLSRPR